MQINSSFEFAKRIFDPSSLSTCKSGFHRELLGSLLTLEGQQEYSSRQYLSSLLGSSNPEP